jgi:acyl-CoA dehydrogenase
MQQQMSDFARRWVAGRELRAAEQVPAALWRAMGEEGLFRIGLPERYGGTGEGYAAIAAADAALVAASGVPGLGLAWAGHQLVARFFVAGFGDEAQQGAYLPGLAEGRLTAAVAISEPGAGAHPKKLRATAAAAGDDFVIDGEKAWCTNGPIADLFIVLAITAVERGRNRFSAFLVPRETRGLAIVAAPPLAFLRPAPHCGLRLEGCRVPRANMLGPPGQAFELMGGPFRDIEDAVGAGSLHGALTALLRQLAAAIPSEKAEEAAPAVGELAALTALLGQAARAVAAALDGEEAAETPALLVGVRALAALLLDKIAACRAACDTAARDGADPLIADLTGSLGVARIPRQVKQSRLGLALMERPD